MKIVVYGDERRVAAWEQGRVIDLARAQERHGVRGMTLAAQLPAFIAAGRQGLETARRVVESARGDEPGDGVVFEDHEVSLHAPWPGRRIACVGGNFADHLLGMQLTRAGETPLTLEQVRNRERTFDPWGFWKVPADVVGPGGTVPYPRRTQYLDYEGEPAIVLGARGKDIAAGDYKAYVWGVTLLNDGSLRDGPSGQPPRGLSYNLAKNFDGSTAIGPCIVVDEVDPENIVVETRINGELRQQFNSRDMIFSWGEVLAYLSRDFTWVPGDIISGGTAAGTAADKTPRGPDGSRSSALFLKRRDVVEISSPDIGALRFEIV